MVSQFTLYGDVRRGRRPSFDARCPARAGLGHFTNRCVPNCACSGSRWRRVVFAPACRCTPKSLAQSPSSSTASARFRAQS